MPVLPERLASLPLSIAIFWGTGVSLLLGFSEINTFRYHRNKWTPKQRKTLLQLVYVRVLFTAVEQLARVNIFLLSHSLGITSMPTNTGFPVQFKLPKHIRPSTLHQRNIPGSFVVFLCFLRPWWYSYKAILHKTKPSLMMRKGS